MGTKDIAVAVEAKTRNNAGEVIGTTEQYVPGERTFYQVNYVCKNCGATCHSNYAKDKAHV